VDPLARLGRKDKWFLGGGKGAIYAPPFPKHLLAPGFWDECYLADVRLSRLFSALVTDADGRPIRFESYNKGWRPDRLTIMHYAGDVVIRERRCVLPCNAWVSELELVTAVRPLNVFMWSLQDVRPVGNGTPWQSLRSCDVKPDSLSFRFDTAWPEVLLPDRTAVEAERVAGSRAMLDPLPVYLELGASHERQSWTVNLAERHDDSPLYETSLLPEKFRHGALPGDFKLFVGTEPVEGMAHLVQHYVLEDRRPLQLVCGAGLSPREARASLEEAREDGAVDRSATAWRAYFASVPQFESSDPYLTSAYWYRWYGLRLNTVDMPGLRVFRPDRIEKFSPFVTEGIGFFRNFITYSAQAHLREVAWMHDPSLAIGILDNLGKVQGQNGEFPGHNYSCRPARDFYHADFATGLQQLARLHRTPDLLPYLKCLKTYADYFVKERLSSAGALVFDQNETGQEYMSRYGFALADADKWKGFRIVGVDATSYLAQLYRVLLEFRPASGEQQGAWLDSLLGHHRDPLRQVNLPFKDDLDERSYTLSQGLDDLLNRDDRFICDRQAKGDALSPARPATGFYPLMLNPVPLRQRMDALEIVHRWLIEPKQFWLPAGFPATAKSDETFSAEGEWKEKRLNCPWNGRSWPMANSHLVDALANVARTLDPTLRQKAGEGLMKAIKLMFHNGDPLRPNSYEHYDPITGVPALYRGYDDYMHSWIVDLILRHAVGVIPGQDEVDPLPLDVDWITCTDIPHPKGRMDVRIERGKPPTLLITQP
jgi:hypothetical protein